MGNAPLTPRMSHSTFINQERRWASSVEAEGDGVTAKRMRIAAYQSAESLDGDCLHEMFEHFSIADALQFALVKKRWETIARAKLASLRSLNTVELIDEEIIEESPMDSTGRRLRPPVVKREPFHARFKFAFEMGVGKGLLALTFQATAADIGDELFGDLPEDEVRLPFDFRIEGHVIELVRERAPQLRSLAFKALRVTPAAVDAIGGFSELRALRFTSTMFDWRSEATYEPGVYLHCDDDLPAKIKEGLHFPTQACPFTEETRSVCERSLVGALNALAPHLRDFRTTDSSFRRQLLLSQFMPALSTAPLLEVVDVSGDTKGWLPAFLRAHSKLVEFVFDEDTVMFGKEAAGHVTPEGQSEEGDDSDVAEEEEHEESFSSDDEDDWESYSDSDESDDDDEEYVVREGSSTVALLVEHCPELRRLTIHEPDKSIADLPLLHDMTHLCLGLLPIEGGRDKKLTDDIIVAICAKSPNLRVFCFESRGEDEEQLANLSRKWGNFFVNTDMLDEVYEPRKLRKGDLTARAFTEGIASLHSLEVLSIEGATALDAIALESICVANATHLRAVRFIHLGPKLDGDRLAVLAHECPQLEYVQINNLVGPEYSQTSPGVVRRFIEAVLDSDWPQREIRLVVKNFDVHQLPWEEDEPDIDFEPLLSGVADFGSVQVFYVLEDEHFP